jgi:hypothetical protein
MVHMSRRANTCKYIHIYIVHVLACTRTNTLPIHCTRLTASISFLSLLFSLTTGRTSMITHETHVSCTFTHIYTHTHTYIYIHRHTMLKFNLQALHSVLLFTQLHRPELGFVHGVLFRDAQLVFGPLLLGQQICVVGGERVTIMCLPTTLHTTHYTTTLHTTHYVPSSASIFAYSVSDCSVNRADWLSRRFLSLTAIRRSISRSLCISSSQNATRFSCSPVV